MHLESVVIIWRLKGDNIAHHPSCQKREFVNIVNYNQKQRNILCYFVPGIDSELFKSIAMQDRNVYSIPHCDIFAYLMNNHIMIM